MNQPGRTPPDIAGWRPEVRLQRVTGYRKIRKGIDLLFELTSINQALPKIRRNLFARRAEKDS